MASLVTGLTPVKAGWNHSRSWKPHGGMSFNRQDASGVKEVIGVRVSSCQRNTNGGVAQQVRARPCQGRGHEFEPRRHRSECQGSCGEKEIMLDYGSGGGGSSPSGSASRSASSMGEHAVYTRGTNRFDSFAEHGGCSSTRESAGPWTRRLRVRAASVTPSQGRVIGSAASRKAVGRPATGGSSPSPGTHVLGAAAVRGSMSPWRRWKARLFPEQQVARSSRAGDTGVLTL